MSRENLVGEFLTRLKGLKEQKGSNMGIEDISLILSGITGTLGKHFSEGELQIFNELKSITKTITTAKADITNIDMGNLSGDHIQGANVELDEVIKATEKATNTILDSAEVIQNALSGLDPEKSKLIGDHVVKIFEACNFQDITGQRINKVLKLLVDIETRLNKLLNSASDSGGSQKTPGASNVSQFKKPDINDEKSLLNGPQLTKEAPSQDDIDKLFPEL